MANVFLSARESTKVKAPVASATVIEVGDFLYHDTTNNDVRPASSQTDNVGEEANQAEFATLFVGVALHASASGDTDDILVETSTTKEYSVTIVSGTPRLGALLGISEASGTALADQTLEIVTSYDVAIAVVTDDSASARTTVKCRLIRSKFGYLPSPRPQTNTETLAGTKTMTHDDVTYQILDPDGSNRNVDLPAEEESDGLVFHIVNTGGATAEVITIRNDAAGTVGTLAGGTAANLGEHGFCVCDGTTWFVSVGGVT
jgi:hypothetical protein